MEGIRKQCGSLRDAGLDLLFLVDSHLRRNVERTVSFIAILMQFYCIFIAIIVFLRQLLYFYGNYCISIAIIAFLLQVFHFYCNYLLHFYCNYCISIAIIAFVLQV